MSTRKLTATDLEVLLKIEQEQPVPPNYLIRLELLGLARDEAKGARLTLAGRRALAAHEPAPATETPPPEPGVEEDDGTRARKRKKRYNRLF